MSKILIVEDSPDFCVLVTRILQFEGHELITASSIGQAFVRLSEAAFDLVILDVTLPDGDGIQLCTDLQATLPRPKILLMTGRTEFTGNFAEFFADGGIAKPFRPQDLRDKVHMLLTPMDAALP